MRGKLWPRLLIGIGALLVARAGASFLFSGVTDDHAWIAFRYARNLANGYGLVFNPHGLREEGYSDFLWVLSLAAVYRFYKNLWVASQIFGWLCYVAAYVFTSWAALGLAKDGLAGKRAPLPALLVVLTGFCLSFSSCYWATYGMQAPMVQCTSALFLASFIRYLTKESEGRYSLLPPVVAGFLYGISRTEADFHVAAALVGTVAAYGFWHWRGKDERSGRLLKRSFRVARWLIPLLLLEFVGEWLYFRNWISNPYFVQTRGIHGFHFEYILHEGFLKYVRDYPLFSAAVGVALLTTLVRFARRTLTPAAVIVPAWILTYLPVLMNGDMQVFPYYRFVVHLYPALLLLLVLPLLDVSSSFLIGGRDIRKPAARVVFLILLFVLATSDAGNWKVMKERFGIIPFKAIPDNARNPPRWIMEENLRNPEFDVARWLQANTKPNATVVLLQSGVIPYYSDRVVYDAYGFNTYEIARLRWLPDNAHRRAEALLKKNPDFLVFDGTKQGDSFELQATVARVLFDLPSSKSYTPLKILSYGPGDPRCYIIFGKSGERN